MKLSKFEIQSGLTRVRMAELLIQQITSDHAGRNSWLLNYGTGFEAQQLRKNHQPSMAWDEKTASANFAEKKPKWKKEKKWQRKGGNVKYIDVYDSWGTASTWDFRTPGTYECVLTPHEERLQNLNEYQDSGGDVESAYKGTNDWTICKWRFDEPKSRKYRKVAKF